MDSKILSKVSEFVIPFIQIFGIYVIVNGHLSPGGGFAGGTIIGVSFILYRIVNGPQKAKKKLPYKFLIKIICFSLITYGLLKGYSFIDGGLDLHLPRFPLGTPGKIFSAGYLLPLNIFVGAVVAITMYFFYSLFSEGEI
ncbi:MnhB domain-containing protein [Tepidibacter formicigenes]|jgi:multicomponent Na+:H+ antiporter subunit B|uniref:Multisubunit sodium/proton antiporter, MrpB subunit n=1 Tax=Tepidibacter formicigenes DSM 15518 TaxID=1123349 RepID=A0A1M6NX41_9FIRM|nr:MnhB domain-containing protein [Tepidibacter formicigenes]SHK00194.1 multisubunit sodium/proton antiporter, MrpB subunit [Tepidibacter formicigenes DSM 15518]